MAYIYLDRQIQYHWTYQDKPFSKGLAWIDLLMLADYYDHSKLWRGRTEEFKRGDVNRSITFLAERWGWSRNKVKRFLNDLETDGMVTVKGTTRRTVITIVNYGVYQGRRSNDGPTNESNRGPSNESTDEPTDGPHIKNNNKKQGRRKKEKTASPEWTFERDEIERMLKEDPDNEEYFQAALKKRDEEGGSL